jgi:hypothetical protein
MFIAQTSHVYFLSRAIGDFLYGLQKKATFLKKSRMPIGVLRLPRIPEGISVNMIGNSVCNPCVKQAKHEGPARLAVSGQAGENLSPA